MTTYTSESVSTAGKLCRGVTGLPQNKAAIAAMMAEAFVNGMRAQERLTCDSAAQRPQT